MNKEGLLRELAGIERLLLLLDPNPTPFVPHELVRFANRVTGKLAHGIISRVRRDQMVTYQIYPLHGSGIWTLLPHHIVGISGRPKVMWDRRSGWYDSTAIIRLREKYKD